MEKCGHQKVLIKCFLRSKMQKLEVFEGVSFHEDILQESDSTCKGIKKNSCIPYNLVEMEFSSNR